MIFFFWNFFRISPIFFCFQCVKTAQLLSKWQKIIVNQKKLFLKKLLFKFSVMRSDGGETFRLLFWNQSTWLIPWVTSVRSTDQGLKARSNPSDHIKHFSLFSFAALISKCWMHQWTIKSINKVAQNSKLFVTSHLLKLFL